MGDPGHILSIRNSFYTLQYNKHLPDNICKSDMNVLGQRLLAKHQVKPSEVPNVQSFCEYYKKYEYDALPVKDSSFHITSDSTDKPSLANSDLDKLEMNILKNTSQEFATHKNPITSLESHIKFFKITVQEIFDNFYASMRDFELYKKRFHEILEKNQEEAVAEMEDFIKDTIQHIMSSEGSISNGSRLSSNSNTSSSSKAMDNNRRTDEVSITSNTDENNREIYIKNPEETRTFHPESFNSSVQRVVEAYNNYDYTTDSTMDDNKTEKLNSDTTKDEVLNIYLLNKTPCVQINMTDRNLSSEINIKEPSQSVDESRYVASAENVRILAAKKKELEKYVQQKHNYDVASNREIPVKVSYAKRNIHVTEELTHDRETERSFISKLCNYLCKRFRKS